MLPDPPDQYSTAGTNCTKIGAIVMPAAFRAYPIRSIQEPPALCFRGIPDRRLTSALPRRWTNTCLLGCRLPGQRKTRVELLLRKDKGRVPSGKSALRSGWSGLASD